MKFRDELVEIDCERLRFDASETQSLLNDIAGLQLAGEDVAALSSSTDGWVAARIAGACSLCAQHGLPQLLTDASLG